MFTRKPYTLRLALLCISPFFCSVSAFAQKLPLQGVPSVNLGLSAPNLPIVQPKLPPLEATVRVPSVGGLTPTLNVNVGPGAPPLPETSPPPTGGAPQLAERRLELLPTCR